MWRKLAQTFVNKYGVSTIVFRHPTVRVRAPMSYRLSNKERLPLGPDPIEEHPVRYAHINYRVGGLSGGRKA